MCACACVAHVSLHVCRGQRTTFEIGFFPFTMWLLRTEFRSSDLVASKCLYPLSHLAGPGSLLFDTLLLVSLGLTKGLEKHSSISTVSLYREQHVLSSVPFIRMLVPRKKGGGIEGVEVGLGAELFGLLALFWAWPLGPEDNMQIGFWQDRDRDHSEGSQAAGLGPAAATLTATIR